MSFLKGRRHKKKIKRREKYRQHTYPVERLVSDQSWRIHWEMMTGILPTSSENCILALTKSQSVAITAAVYPSHTDAWKVTCMCLYSMLCEGCLVVDRHSLSLPKEYLRGTHRKDVVHQTKLVWLPAQMYTRIRISGCRRRYMVCWSRPIVLCTSFNCCCSCMHSWYALWMSKVPSIFSLRKLPVHFVHPHCL